MKYVLSIIFSVLLIACASVSAKENKRAPSSMELMEVVIGQQVQITDASALVMIPKTTIAYATLVGAKKIDSKTIELEFEPVISGPDRIDAANSGLKPPSNFKVFITPVNSLSDIKGIKIISQ